MCPSQNVSLLQSGTCVWTVHRCVSEPVLLFFRSLGLFLSLLHTVAITVVFVALSESSLCILKSYPVTEVFTKKANQHIDWLCLKCTVESLM